MGEIRILLIDDDKDEFYITKRHLSLLSAPYVLNWVDDCDSALAAINENPPDVCLVDYQLKGDTGLDLIQEIKKKGLKIPLILLTGFNSIELNRKAIKLGADDYLPKQEVTPTALDRAIQHSMERQKATQALVKSEANFRELSELSSAVLHNAANLLNTMLTSSLQIKEIVQDAKTSSLEKASLLLKTHRHHLADFIQNDSKGKLLPEFLTMLCEHMTAQQARLLSEAENNLSKIQLMEEIIHRQQTAAKTMFSEGFFDIVEAIDAALSVNREVLARYNIRTERQITAKPMVKGSQSKITHVFINLIKNAIEAMVGATKRELRVLLDCSQSKVEIRFNDSGTGIEASSIAHVFDHGFTTKDTGHGFGLHFCAKVVREMGGSIAAESGSEGTTFFVSLPEGQ